MIEKYLSDELWESVAPILPGKEGDPGCSGRDNRQFLEAVFWIARTGSPWRSLPSEYGKWYTTYTRFHRWSKKGVWPRVVAVLEQHGANGFSADQNGLRWSPLRAILPNDKGPATDDRAAA